MNEEVLCFELEKDDKDFFIYRFYYFVLFFFVYLEVSEKVWKYCMNLSKFLYYLYFKCIYVFLFLFLWYFFDIVIILILIKIFGLS